MATTFFVVYPSSPVSISAIGTNGATAPSTSIQVAGVGVDGNLHPLSTTNTGVLNVNLSSTTTTPLPVTDAAAEASLASIDTKTPTVGQKLAAASSPVVLASDQTLPLPAGAATEATLAKLTLAQGSTTSGQSGPLMQAAVLTAAPTYSNAQTSPLTLTTAGALRVDVSGSAAPTGAATSANQTNGSQKTQVVDGSGNVQPSGDTAARAIFGLITNGTNTASVSAASALKVDGSAVTQPVSGTVTANQGTANTAANGWPVKPTDGTNSQTFTAGGAGNVQIAGPLGQSAAASSVATTLSNENVQDLFVTGQSAQTATVNNILPAASGASATDLTGYRSAAVQVVSTASGGTFIFEGSNDNTNFQTIPVWSQLILTGTPIVAAVTATSSQLIYIFPVTTRYVRLRIASTITGGNIQAFSKFSQTSFAPGIQQIAQATAANLNATVTATNLSTNVAQMNGVAVTMGNGVSGTGVQRVVIASDNTSNTNAFLVSEEKAATSTLSNVASSATTVTLLASNAGRKQATFFNDSTQTLYLKFGATASTTSYTVQIPTNGYYELPGVRVYTGIIDGLWASANGNLRVTELT